MRMVSSGGAYAEAIFVAFSTAARNGEAVSRTVQNKEIPQDEHRDKRARVEDGVVEEKMEGLVVQEGDVALEKTMQDLFGETQGA